MPTDSQSTPDTLPSDTPMVVTGGGKTKQKVNIKTIALILGIFILLGGIATGYYLLQQNQDIREKAQGGEEKCTVSQCPSDEDPNRLAECSDLDGTYDISLCNASRAKTIVTCDGEPFCCPYAGGDWTSDLTDCETPATATPTVRPTATATGITTPTPTSTSSLGVTTPTPTSTSSLGVTTPTPTSTSSLGVKTPTPTPTGTGTTTKTATPAPIPESGISTPTILGLGIGAVLLLVSLALVI